MANKPALETRWGGPTQNWAGVILDPVNKESDLILQSEVLVQTFFSLQKHVYHYKIVNGTATNNIFCDLRVKWNKTGIDLTHAKPGLNGFIVESWFSPQATKTTADVDAIAGSRPFSARSVFGEQANAYVPWQKEISKGVLSLLKTVLKHGAVSNAASMVLSAGDGLNLTSQFQANEEGYAYKLAAENTGVTPLRVSIPGLRFVDEEFSLALKPGESKEFEIVSPAPPVEERVFVEVFETCRFPVHVLVSDAMMGRPIKVRRAHAPLRKEIEKKKKKKVREEVLA